MKQKWYKRVLTLIIIGTICWSSAVSVMASSILDEVQVVEANETYSKDTQYSLLRGSHLNFGSTDIGVLSSHEVSVTGVTQCHHVCDKVHLRLYLEQKSGGSYHTYKMWEATKENATNIVRSLNVLVPSGYYYRVRGYHAAEDGSYESASTLTNGLWVG